MVSTSAHSPHQTQVRLSAASGALDRSCLQGAGSGFGEHFMTRHRRRELDAQKRGCGSGRSTGVLEGSLYYSLPHFGWERPSVDRHPFAVLLSHLPCHLMVSR